MDRVHDLDYEKMFSKQKKDNPGAISGKERGIMKALKDEKDEEYKAEE